MIGESTDYKENIATGNIVDPAKPRILLLLLPFWDPEIPPQGISCLKSFIQPHGYHVRTVDGNTEKEFRQLYFRYYDVVQGNVPMSLRRNLFNDGVTLLRNHLMIYLYRDEKDKESYYKLLRILVEKNFFTSFDDSQLEQLEEVVAEYYVRLERWFLALLEQESPSVVGFSAFSATMPGSLFCCRLAKKKDPGIQTLLGGQIFSDQLMEGTPDFDYLMEISKDYLDAVILGEGELLFLAWLRGELPKSQRVFTIKDINGKKVDLAKVNPPDYSDFDLSYYPHVGLYGARSCPFSCSFCSETIYWGAYRKKKMPHLLTEMKELYDRHAYQMFLLTDSLMNPIVTEFARAVIESGYSFYWDGYLRADPPVRNVDNTMLWRKGGFYRAKLGLESGSQKILGRMGKKITVAQVKECIQSLAYAGIKTTTAWMVGHPGETEEDFQQTLDLIEELQDSIYEVKLQYFKFYLRGQPQSVAWAENSFPELIYPDWARDMLVSQSYRLGCLPTWDDTIDRVNRFMEHARQLGVPSNYSLEDVHEADRRWQKLQPNAVPPLVDLQDRNIYIEENKRIEKHFVAVNPIQEDSDWL
ncbi:MAG: radical SAM protein [bacterium]|nr:radical SAM protein [bacterium]